MSNATKDSKPRELEERIPAYFNIWEFETDVDSLIKKLQELKAQHPKYHKISFQNIHYFDHGWDSGIEMTVVGHRYETQAEVDRRLEKARKLREAATKTAETKKKNKEAKELALFQKLQKKYGST